MLIVPPNWSRVSAVARAESLRGIAETRLPDVIGRARADHEGRHEHHRPRAEDEPCVADDEAGDRSHSAARVRRVTWPMPANLLRVPALSAATTSTPAEPL